MRALSRRTLSSVDFSNKYELSTVKSVIAKLIVIAAGQEQYHLLASMYLHNLALAVFILSSIGELKSEAEISVLDETFRDGLIDKAKPKKHDGINKLRSVKNLLGDPRLETFKFIHPGPSGFVQIKPLMAQQSSLRHICVLRFYSGVNSVRKLLKVKVSIPKSYRQQRKIKGVVVFPRNISSIEGECKWDIGKSKGNKVLFVPKACVKLIASLEERKLSSNNVIALLVPRKKSLQSQLKRKITKKFVLFNYGKRMGSLLRKLAVQRKFTRLIVAMKRHERRRS